jgi:DNA-binding response OmpR family regulator
VYSEPGKGTTFRIYLPLVEALPEKEAGKEVIAPSRGTETILVAEDDESVRSLMKTVLLKYGYEVIEASDGDDAIDKLLQNKDRIELVVLDVIMPKKSGKEVRDEIKKIRPDMKVLFTSGYTADIIHKKGILDEEVDFISKPVLTHELLIKIRELLDT